MKKFIVTSTVALLSLWAFSLQANASTLINSYTPGTNRNDFTGCVGSSFTVGASPITITSLGLRMGTGDTGNHTIYLYNTNGSLGGLSILASSTVNLTGGTVGTFYYSSASAVLLANTFYLIGTDVTNGDGQYWADNGSVTFNGATAGQSIFSVDCSDMTSTNGNNSSQQYVGLDANGAVGTSPPPTPTPTSTPDTTPPTISLIVPTNGATVSSAISVTANASDNIGVVGVQFKLDGANLGAEDATAPYTYSWDTTTASNGTHVLTAVARDAAGNQATAQNMTVTVNNVSAPIISLPPANGIVYLRDNPHGFQIVSPGCTNTTPIVCTVDYPSGLSAGQLVVISKVAVDNPGANNISAANGIRKIGAVVGNTISLLDPGTNVPIAGNGVWNDGHGNYAYGGVQVGGVVNPYRLVSGIKGYFDGDSGQFTRAHAQTWQNGLANTNGVQVTGCPSACVVTVTMSSPLLPVMHPGDHFTIWGTSVPAFNAMNDGVTSDLTVAASPAPTSMSYSSNPFAAPAGLTNGDYTHNNDHCGSGVAPNETIQGTDPCVVVSAWAVTTNLAWARLKYYADSLPISYQRFYVDGGQNWAEQGIDLAELPALAFQIDRVNHGQGLSGNLYLDSVLYFLNNIEKVFGSNFIINPAFPDGGNSSNSYGHDNTPQTLATLFGIGQSFLTSAHRAAAIGKMLNDISDPASCRQNLAVPHDTLATGSAAAVTAGSITLSPGDTAADNFYVNNIIEVNHSGSFADLLVTGYNASTKVARGTWSGFTPSPGDTYNIYSTVTIDTTARGATSIITGYNTNFAADVTAGDMLFGVNSGEWGGFDASGAGAWVTSSSVISAQTITNLVNSGAVQISTAIPQIYWRNPKWATGDCGWVWLAKHFDGNGGNTQPTMYGLNGGASMSLTAISSNNNLGHNSPILDMLFALADFDSRAALQASQYQLTLVDYGLVFEWNYLTGFTGSGIGYGLGVTTRFAYSTAWVLDKNVVGYPDVGLHGPFTLGLTDWKTYATVPDSPLWTVNGPVNSPIIYGGAQSNNLGNLMAPWDTLLDYGQAANPTAPESRYLKSLLQAQGFTTVQSIPSTNLADIYVKIDPRIVPLNYASQPLQKFFSLTANDRCGALTWWGPVCNPAIAATAVLSRGWGKSSTLAGAWTDRTASMLQYQARSYADDHDSPQMGTLQIWDVGALRASDELPVGDSGGGAPDVIDSTPEFGGASTMCPGMEPGPGSSNCLSGGGKTTGIAIATIDKWASANHGTWPTIYGDSGSNYAYAHSNLAGAYTTPHNRVVQQWVHLKKPGADEITILYNDIDTSNSPTQIAVHAPFPQNGETVAGVGIEHLSYDEGTTSCPGTGGCANLNSTRAVLEKENGVANSHGNPIANHNLIWKLLVPAGAPNVFVNWDCPGGGQCAPGSTYPGGLGHADRVSICADAGGTGTCSAGGQNGLEAIEVMKIATQPDTSLAATPLNPDTNWTGVQTADKVALFARHGLTYSTISGFTTNHSGTAQYLFAGLTPGSYTVTVNGTAVTGSPFTVVAGDNSLYFESTAGTVSVNGSVNNNPSIFSFDASPTSIANGQSTNLSWSVSGATSLSIDHGVGDVGSLSSVVVAPTVSTNYTLTAANASGTASASALVTVTAGNTTPTSTPLSISNVTVSNIGTSAATVSWDTNVLTNGQVNYGFTSAYGSQSSFSDTNTPATSHSISLSDLSSGVTYHYQIVSVDSSNDVVSSGDNTFATQAPADTIPPAAITDLAASNVGQTSAVLTWTAPGNDSNTGTAASYDIRYATSAITPSTWASATAVTGEPTPSLAGAAQTYTLVGLTAGTTYYVGVETTDGAGNVSALSNISSFTTQVPPVTSGPAPVISNLSANASGLTVTVVWTTDQSATGQAQFGLTFSYGSSTAVNSAITTAHTFTFYNLPRKTTYHYRVLSANTVGTVGTSSDGTFTTTAKPNAVSGLTITSGSVELAWDPVTDPTLAGILVLRTNGTVPPPLPTSTDPAIITVANLPLSATSYHDTAVVAASTYSYSIFTYDSQGNYSDPTSGTFTTGSTAPAVIVTVPVSYATGGGGGGGLSGQVFTGIPSPISQFKAQALDSQAALSWQNPTVSYARTIIVRKPGTTAPTSASDGVKAYEGTGVSYIDIGLTNGTAYTYAAYAINNVPTYSAAATATVTPQKGITQTVMMAARAGGITNTSSAFPTGQAALLALLAKLQAQLKSLIQQALAQGLTLPPGLAAAQPTTGSSVGFSRNLSLGMSGEDVRVLQQFLNSHGFIIIASGPGSPGHEVAVFGLKTKTALAKWQQANGIRATGFFGPATRARMSK